MMLCSLVSLVAVGCGVISYKRWNKASATKTNHSNSSAQQGTLEIISNEQVVFERIQDTKSPGNLIYDEVGSSVKSIYEMDDIMEKHGDDGLPPSLRRSQYMVVIAEGSTVDLSHNSSPPTSSVPPTHTTADPFAKL